MKARSSKELIIKLESRVIDSPMDITVAVYETKKLFHLALKEAGLWEFAPYNTVAFTDTYDDVESVGKFYFYDVSQNSIAHESTHMALHILSLLGNDTMPIVKPGVLAPPIEENLCYLVGDLTELLCGVL